MKTEKTIKLEITQEILQNISDMYELSHIIPGRYSNLFLIDLYVAQHYGINIFAIVDEIKYLESLRGSIGTKPESQFKHEPLKKFFHKHFFSAHFIPKNIQNNWPKAKLEAVIKKIFSKEKVITDKMIRELVCEIITPSIPERAQSKKLTGEWIIYGKHDYKNYYLGLGEHSQSDLVLFNRLKHHCEPQFPFLFSN